MKKLRVHRLRRTDDALVDPDTGEVRRALIFVAGQSESNDTYVCATAGEPQVGWLRGRSHALQFLGGAPALVLYDKRDAGGVDTD